MQKLFFSLIFLSTALFISSCSSGGSSGGSRDYSKMSYDGPPVKNDWLVEWLPANPTSLNPILSTDAYATSVISEIFDTLVYFNPKTGEPMGRLATEWNISKDGLTYEFSIREGVKFHDGSVLTPEDVKFTFDLIKDPKIDAAHLQNYFKDLKSVEVVEKNKVRFHMASPYFRNLIVLGSTEILPRSIYGKGDFNTNPAARDPVGSGPYKFSKWDQGRTIELERNKDFWGLNTEYFKTRYNFNKILFRVITEDSVAAMALKKGDIDIMAPTTTQYLNEFKGEEFEKKFYRLQYSTPDGDGYGYIGWNFELPIFQSKKVRQALSLAMPLDEINQKLYEGTRTLAVGPIPVGSPKVDPSIKPMGYDLDKAKALLSEDGWKDSNGDGFIDKNGKNFQFDLLFTAQNSDSERIALIYRKSLEKLGIQMNIRTLEWTVFIKSIREGKFDAAMLAWGSSLDSDPYQIWHSSQAQAGGSNFIHYKNKKVDELLEKARVTLDRSERNKLYQEFSKIISEDQPYLFIFERPLLFVATKRFQNVLPLGVLGPDGASFFTPPGWEKYQSQ